MPANITVEEKLKLAKLKGLSAVLVNYIFLIDQAQDPSEDIKQTVEAVDYYYRLFKDLQKSAI